MKTKTIAELIEELKEFPADYKWYGYDDGSIIITNPEGVDVGYVDNL